MMTVVEEQALATGAKVGPYTLLFRLGKGGMGEVWAASQGAQMAGFTKLVALKLLLGAESGSNSSIMFFDEARAASALNHAAIVPTLDLGRDQDTFYLAMEMVRGPSLTALLQRLAIKKMVLPPAIVAHVGERIASALDYAYERASIDGKKLRLVHRDISPHNVLLDAAGNVRLSDFGVARTAVQDHKSRYGTVRGKPSYMAPEQVTGGDIDARTDVFALGIVLYECSCVKRLFGRSNPVKSMEAVVNHHPKPLTERNPDFPVELWKVIEKALHKEPKNRWQSAGEFAAALSDAARSLPGSATVTRDMGDLIAELFPAGSFDVDAKAQQALSAIEHTMGGQVTPMSQTGSQSGSAVIPQATDTHDQGLPTAFSEQLQTNIGWAGHLGPAGYNPDPLAPDAIADEEQRLAAMQAQYGNLSAPQNPYGAQPFQTSPSQSSQMYAGAKRGPPGAALAVLAAALVAVAGLGFFLFQQQEADQVAQTAPAKTAEQKPPADTKFGVVAGQANKDKPKEAPTPTDTAAEPAREPAKPTRSTRRTRRPKQDQVAQASVEKAAPKKTSEPAKTASGFSVANWKKCIDSLKGKNDAEYQFQLTKFAMAGGKASENAKKFFRRCQQAK